jgi:hypothetical protein
MRVRWAQGMQAYVSGRWDIASAVFNETLKDTAGRDGPSKFFLLCI